MSNNNNMITEQGRPRRGGAPINGGRPTPTPTNTPPQQNSITPDPNTERPARYSGRDYIFGMIGNELIQKANGVWKKLEGFTTDVIAKIKKDVYNIRRGQSVYDTPENSNRVSNGIYTTNGDPYQYKVVGCVWYTKSLENRGKIIKDWKSLEGNNNATKILDGRFPNARKECKENKPKNSNIVVGGQPQVQVGSTTPTGGQSGVNQSQGLGVPNVSELGLDEIDKLDNPVKPETVTQTSTPTTQQESIKDNVNILKEEFYSTLKKIS